MWQLEHGKAFGFSKAGFLGIGIKACLSFKEKAPKLDLEASSIGFDDLTIPHKLLLSRAC